MRRHERRLHNAAADYHANGWPVALLLPPGVVGIVTQRFDVLELPSPYGSQLYARLLTKCPTAKARKVNWRWGLPQLSPTRWYFYIEQGAVDVEKVEGKGGTLWTGGALVPAPPSRMPGGELVSWLVPPRQVRWTPYTPTTALHALELV